MQATRATSGAHAPVALSSCSLLLTFLSLQRVLLPTWGCRKPSPGTTIVGAAAPVGAKSTRSNPLAPKPYCSQISPPYSQTACGISLFDASIIRLAPMASPIQYDNLDPLSAAPVNFWSFIVPPVIICLAPKKKMEKLLLSETNTAESQEDPLVTCRIHECHLDIPRTRNVPRNCKRIA